MVHWGLYSVPGWAERSGTIQYLWQKRGPNHYFKHNPYAEWYANTIQIDGSGAQRHHASTYGASFPYDGFVPQFDRASANADFSQWANLFAEAHARYVVLTTKHMDGFALWPSAVPNPRKSGYHASRDIVGDVTAAVRARGLTMGLYYSAGYDLTFNGTVIRDAAAAIRAIPQDPDYADYVDRQLIELIERYQPSVLWNDISYPVGADLERLFRFYYDAVAEGVVNDRWARIGPARGVTGAALSGIRGVLPYIWPLLPSSLRRFRVPQGARYDFATPEYAVETAAVERKWEAVRGIGPSFGNNRNELAADMPTTDELVHLLVDVVSKNGNLLLGVGPEPDGTIPALQRERLLNLGHWLAVNGEAIFGTRPWRRAEGRTADGRPVRFTTKDGALYAIILGAVTPGPLTIEEISVSDDGTVSLLGSGATLQCDLREGGRSIVVPTSVPPSAAYAFRIRGATNKAPL